jgi:hypothetical protein
MARLDELTARTHRGAVAFGFSGEVGIGKTTMWSEALARALATGMQAPDG